MINRLKPKSEFSRNVLTLMTGTMIAQVLPVAAAPILTRIYSPKDFGLFALYFAIVSILSVFATARYELAIILPKNRLNAYHLLVMSWVIAVIISSISSALICAFDNQIIEIVGNEDLHNWLYYIPFSIFLTGVYQSFYYWFNREKKYSAISTSKVIQSGSMVTFQLLLGWMGKLGGAGLLVGHLLAQFVAVSIMLGVFSRNAPSIKKLTRLKHYSLLKRYSSFPKYMVPAHLMNVFSYQAPNIFLNVFYSTVSAGYFVLVQRVISAPLSLIGSAIGDVFRKEADFMIKETGGCRKLFISTMKKLVLISFAPFSLFFIVAPEFFAIVFGVEWKEAGEIARILLPMFFLQFISSPLSALFIVKEKQKIYLNIQLLLATCVVLSFFWKNLSFTIISISVSFSFIYILMLIQSYKLSKARKSIIK